MFMMSIDTASSIESTKILIPDNYQFKFEEWNEVFVPNTINGLKLYPWEVRVEKAFFRGRPTGVNQDYFPAY